MNDKIIRELADKMGTTAEHLWAVLVLQAPISGAVVLLQYAALAVACIFYVRLVKWTQSNACHFQEVGVVGSFMIGVLLLVLTVLAFSSIPMTLAAFFNPEYWALKQLIP